MKQRNFFSFIPVILALAAGPIRGANQPSIFGDYVEVRTCNVYAAGCIANGEMGLTGKEGIMLWSVREGAWKGVRLDGLKVLAVISAPDTLGDLRFNPTTAKAVLIVDASANMKQRHALTDLARALSGKLIAEVVEVKRGNIDVALASDSGSQGASVKAGDLVEIETQGLAGHKSSCGGGESIIYPPLTEVKDAKVGFTARAAYRGTELNRTWENLSVFSAYVGKFSR